VIFGNCRAAQPSSPAELGCIESKAGEMEPEGPEARVPKFIPSLGSVDRLIARTAGLPVAKQCDDLLWHARGQGALVNPRANVVGETHGHTPSGERESTTKAHSCSPRRHHARLLRRLESAKRREDAEV
jgi:hypothetical protein